jgi:hypothetical protein
MSWQGEENKDLRDKMNPLEFNEIEQGIKLPHIYSLGIYGLQRDLLHQ